MAGSHDEVIERTRVREVAGVFHAYDPLDAAADDLLQAGFDRADVDIIGDLRVAYRRIGAYVAPEELADVSVAPRRPYFNRQDVAVATSVVAGTLACIVGMAVAYDAAVSSVSTGVAVGAALVAALAAGGVVAGFVARHLGRRAPEGMEWLVPERGIIIWVRVRSPEQERAAQAILRSHGAQAVRVHEIEIDKRTEDLPLASLRPDPWLGSERLGETSR
jgi:hypothetical protein